MKSPIKVAILAGAISALTITSVNAAGYREQGHWRFDDPVTTAVKLQKEVVRQRKKNGFDIPKITNIGTVNASIQHADIGSFQNSTNIANMSNIEVDATVDENGYLTIDSGQDSSGSSQSAKNRSYVNY